MNPLKSVVVGIDGSSSSANALAWSLDRLPADGALHAVHAFNPRQGLVLAAIQQDSGPRRRTAEDLLRGPWTAAITEAGIEAQHHFVDDDAADALVEIATDAEVEATMIVIGSHGEGGRRFHFVGGVIRKLLRKSPVPLIVVATPPEADAAGAVSNDSVAAAGSAVAGSAGSGGGAALDGNAGSAGGAALDGKVGSGVSAVDGGGAPDNTTGADVDEAGSRGEILVCVSYGQEANEAISWAADYALATDRSLHLLHAVSDRPLYPIDSPVDMLGSYLGPGVDLEWAIEDLEDAAAGFRKIWPTLDITTTARLGSTVSTIVDVADGVDLVVVGKAHSEGLSRFIISPRIHQLLTRISCSAAIVPSWPTPE